MAAITCGECGANVDTTDDVETEPVPKLGVENASDRPGAAPRALGSGTSTGAKPAGRCSGSARRTDRALVEFPLRDGFRTP